MNNERYIVCLPGGEWFPSVCCALANAGMEVNSRGSRSYLYDFASANEKLPLRFVVTRSKDVWENVRSDETLTNAGITGSDIALDQLANAVWNFPLWQLYPDAINPSVDVALTPNFVQSKTRARLEDLTNTRVYTAYPNLANRYFQKQGVSVDIRERDGKIEGMWNIDPLCMAIVDIVSSGSTMEANNLVRFLTVMKPELWLVQNPEISEEEQLVLFDFRQRLERAADQRRGV